MLRMKDQSLTSSRFSSIAEAQRRHLELVERVDAIEKKISDGKSDGEAAGELARLRLEIRRFEWQLAASGATLARPDVRNIAQSVLDYWALRQADLRTKSFELRKGEKPRPLVVRTPSPRALLPVDTALASKLADKAEATFRQLPEEARDEAKQLFLGIVDQARGGTGARIERGSRPGAAGTGEPHGAVEAFKRSGVINVSERGRDFETVVLAHDLLAETWPRLAQWIAEKEQEEREFALVQKVAKAWDTNRWKGDLPKGQALKRAARYSHRDPTIKKYVKAARRENRRTLLTAGAVLFLTATAIYLLGQWQGLSTGKAEVQAGASLAETEYQPRELQTRPVPTIAWPGTDGWMWGGTPEFPQIGAEDGRQIDPAQVRRGMRVQLRLPIKLRSSPTTGDDATPETAIGAAGTLAIVLEDARAAAVKGTEQFWLRVRLVPRIYIQIPQGQPNLGGGLRTALLNAGYDVPAFQEVPGIKNIHEVRYYFQQDELPAAGVAAAANKQLGRAADDPDAVKPRSFIGTWLQSRAVPGTVELWVTPGSTRQVAGNPAGLTQAKPSAARPD